jgi:hypothetical protein
MGKERELNSLDRFRKQSSRLVLEVHDHCEVPAGCAGVVLRWRNPLAAQPLRIYLYSPVKPVCLFDSEELRSSRIDLEPGTHVAGFVLQDAGFVTGLLLMFAGVFDPARNRHSAASALTEAPFALITAGDGTWKYTLEEPAGNWQDAAFDDSAWVLLVVHHPAPQPETRDRGYYQWLRCQQAGAVSLGAVEGQMLARPALATVWIRKVFTIPLPEETAAS